MRKEKHSRRHGGAHWKNSGRHGFEERQSGQVRKPVFRPTIKPVSQEQIREDEEAIREFKLLNQPACALCGQPVKDMSCALNVKSSGGPVHFDCALESVAKNESLGQGDKVAYIGQGRFAVIHYANIHDTKHFSIRKIIDWEEKDSKPAWRSEMADLYSKVK